jgi:hypothetical protein
MKYSLVRRPGKKGKTSLILRRSDGQQRKQRSLKMLIYTNPKSNREREHNKETLAAAQGIVDEKNSLAAENRHGKKIIDSSGENFMKYLVDL